MKRKDTEAKSDGMEMYEVRVQYTTWILGRDLEDAMSSYKDWLKAHTKDHTILDVKYTGKAW